MALEKIKGERAIKALKPGAGRLNDGGGLYLLPFAWGESHYWRMDYTHHSRRRTLSLGSHHQVGLDEARALAKAARAKLAMGVNPMDERHEQRAQHRRSADDTGRAKSRQPVSGSFEEVTRRWFEVKSSQWMETYSSKVIRRLKLHAFPRFGTMPIGEITPKTVLEACRAVERNDTLETAHRLREHCSCVFRFAVAEGADLRDPCADNRHDSKLLEPLLDAVVPVHNGQPGRPRQRPVKLHADKGYNHAFCRRACRQRGIKARIARRGVESTQRLGRFRWVVERTLAWLARFRRLTVRYEHRADIHTAFLTLGCALICWRQVQRL